MPLPLTISCSSKSRLVLPCWFLPFWYLLTRVVPDKFQKRSKMVVCVCVCDQKLLFVTSHLHLVLPKEWPCLNSQKSLAPENYCAALFALSQVYLFWNNTSLLQTDKWRQMQADHIYCASIMSQGKHSLPEIFRIELVTLYACRQCNVALSRWGAVHCNGTKFAVVIADIIVETWLQRCPPWLSYFVHIRWPYIGCLFAQMIVSAESIYVTISITQMHAALVSLKQKSQLYDILFWKSLGYGTLPILHSNSGENALLNYMRVRTATKSWNFNSKLWKSDS